MQVERAEQRAQHDRACILVAPRSPTCWTRHLLGHATAHLLLHDHCLHLLEKVLGLGQVQAQRVDVQVATFDLATSCTAGGLSSSASTMICTRTFIPRLRRVRQQLQPGVC
jgi:hypothetical protein